MHSERLLRRFMSPTHHGEINEPDGLGIEGNATCGDVVHLAVRFDAGRVAEAKFAARGCTIAIAAADAACELLHGCTLTAAETLGVTDIERIIGDVPADRYGCVQLVLGALRGALEQARAALTAGTA